VKPGWAKYPPVAAKSPPVPGWEKKWGLSSVITGDFRLEYAAELENFEAGSLKGMSAELWWCLKEAGVKPKTLRPGLYDFELEALPGPEFREEIPSSFEFRYAFLPRETDDLLRKGRNREKTFYSLLNLVKEGRFRISPYPLER